MTIISISVLNRVAYTLQMIDPGHFKRELWSTMDTDRRCVFCGSNSNEIEKGGDIMFKKGIFVHKYCLYFASGLAQRGEEDSDDSLSGFLLADIRAEVRRSAMLKCTVCACTGASIGCAVARCKSKGHYPCLRSKGYLFRHFGRFEVFCPQHSPRQRSAPITDQKECSICLMSINAVPGYPQLCCPNCSTYFHRECIQRQALSAGRHYLRCPMCNNKDGYVDEMLAMGIDVPEKDAEWELNGQFVEDVDVNKYCRASKCLCPPELGGHSHHSGIGKYKMRKCVSCGQWIGHVLCLKGQSEQCSDCEAVPLRTLPSTSVYQPSPSSSHKRPSLSRHLPKDKQTSQLSNGLLKDQPSSSLSRDRPSPSLSRDRPSPSLSRDRPSPSLSRDRPSPALSRDRPSPSLSRDRPSPALSRDRPSPSLSRNHKRKQPFSTKKPTVPSLIPPPSVGIREQRDECCCRICVARYKSSSRSVPEDSGSTASKNSQPLIVSIPRERLETSYKSLFVSIPLNQLHFARSLSSTWKTTHHCSVYKSTSQIRKHRALRQLVRSHPGMKLLDSVCISKLTCRLVTGRKELCYRKD